MANRHMAKQKQKKKLGKGATIACVLVVLVTVVACVGIIASMGNDKAPAKTSDNSSAATSESVPEPAKTDAKELVTLDGVKISFTGFSDPPATLQGCYINLRIENTSDTDYTIQCEDLSIDDQMIPIGNYAFSAEVLAGKSLNTYIWAFNFEQLGIERPVTSAECKFYMIPDMTTMEITAESDTILIN